MQESFVFHRRLDRKLPRASSAKGVYIFDEEGKRYIDACGGPICVNVGHGRKEIVRAMAEQAGSVAYAHGTMFTTDVIERLALELSRHSPQGIERFYFCSSGCEAVETAIKLARQIHLANGQPERYRLISRRHSYHGSTIGALSVGGKISMRRPFVPMLLSSIHIPVPYCLRCHYHLSYPSCGLRCALALEDAILLEGAQTISAFIVEPVCGSTVGAVVPPPEYNKLIAEICAKHSVLLILDEVMTGMGRTGAWFAAEHFQIKPDLLIMGKGLSGGYIPLSAVGCRIEHLHAIRKHAGNFIHGHTFSHHAVAAAAGLSVLEIIQRECLVDRVAVLGKYLEEAFLPLRRDPHVADVRGIGLMWAVELIQDKQTKKPYPRSAMVAERLFDRLLEGGVLTYKCAGFVDGDGDALMIGPPFIITENELDFVVKAIQEAVEDLLG